MTKLYSRVFFFFSIAATLGAACVNDEPGDDPAVEPSYGEAASAITPSEEESAVPVPYTSLVRVSLFMGDVLFRAQNELNEEGTATAPSITVLSQSRPDSAGKAYLLTGDRSALETYLLITSASTPVPRLLLTTEPSQAIRDRAAGRTVVETISAPVTGLPQLAIASLTQPVAAASYCTGTTSASWAADICTLTNWDVDYCHNGTWYSVTDSVGSSNKKRDSRGVTLGCGANSRVRHYYKAGGIWYETIDETFPSGQIWQTTKDGSWALSRAVKHTRTASGFVRASSHFNVPF